ncbi:hypothetical protein GA0070606_0503 [Micromonospora citrea]|uniref:LysM domain-containing protein n=1 Tax=Micromonospora citrea TaxID=47855 RepID=A0A1C6TSW4_9ACTN|nr:LysM peptidoglycan-binding domain-containing protein [Micromonospora citrea]SCL44892.1 hypothetical protein GA0070606_0503 [Micromonospora citrea]
MTPRDIYDALDRALHDRRITLTSGTVAGLGPALVAIGVTGSLEIREATLNLNANDVLLTGIAAHLHHDWAVTVRGAPPPNGDSDNSFTLTLREADTGQAPWTIGTSFRGLPRSRIAAPNGTLPLGDSVLVDLTIEGPELTTTPAGRCTLRGWLLLTVGPLAPYRDLFGATTLPLEGTVDMTSTPPKISAYSTLTSLSLPLAPQARALEVGISLDSQTTDAYPPGDPVSVISLSARVHLPQLDQEMTFTAPLLQGDEIWALSMRSTKPLTVRAGLDLVLAFFDLPATDLDLVSLPLARELLAGIGVARAELGLQRDGRSLRLRHVGMALESLDDKHVWHPSVAFITLSKLGVSWMYHRYDDDSLLTGNVWGRFTFFEDSSHRVDMQVTVALPSLFLTAETLDEIEVPLDSVLRHYLDPVSSPNSDAVPASLTISDVSVEAAPRSGWFRARITVRSSWTVTLDGPRLTAGQARNHDPTPLVDLQAHAVTFSIDRISAELGAAQNGIFGSISGLASIITRTGAAAEETKAVFVVTADYQPDAGWHFCGGLAEGTLNVGELAAALLGVDLPRELSEISLTALWLEYTASGEEHPYSARGALTVRWCPTVLDGITLSIEAAASIRRKRQTTTTDEVRALAAPGTTDSGMIYEGSAVGTVRINSFRVTVGLSFVAAETVYLFEVAYGSIVLRAATDWAGSGTARHQVLTVTLSGLTLGDVVTYLVRLASPGSNYTLDAPWSLLNEVDLSRFTLSIDPTDQVVSLTYRVDLDLGFGKLTRVGVRYERSTGEDRVNLVVEGDLLGRSYTGDNALTWDAVNDPPPEIPGKGPALLRLDYLGLGQHVRLRRPPARTDSISDVLAELRAELVPPKSATQNPFDGSAIVYDLTSQWMFGLDCTVLGMARIGIVLHDPDLYGLVVSLAGADAGVLAGLSFELRYQKVTADVGVFRVRLQVPDAFRHLNLGPVALSIGRITVEVFTNGNFTVDLGFPHDRDFSYSFGLAAGPFSGAGGLYFGLLDGATSSRVPAITNGTFSPVLELGVGLSVGVGREISYGPLRAGFQLQLVAIVEGVLAWFRPTDASAPKELYHWVQGSAGLVGKLYGSIDLTLIKVAVNVEAHAVVGFTLAAYRATLVELDVGVSVEAELTILFVRVSFTFQLRLTASFVIGEDRPMPWSLAPGQTDRSPSPLRGSVAVPRRRRPAQVTELTRLISRRARTGLAGVERADTDFTWPTGPVFPDGKPHPVVARMLPVYTVDGIAVRWPGFDPPPPATSAVRVVLLLMVENGVPPARARGRRPALTVEGSAAAVDPAALSFPTLVEAMLRWVLAAAGIDPTGGTVSPGELAELAEWLDRPAAATALTERVLDAFLRDNIELRVSGVPSGATTPGLVGGTVLPIPPPLGWDCPAGAQDRRFTAYRMITPEYAAHIADHFSPMDPRSSADRHTDRERARVDDQRESMASVLFRDYFLLIAKAAVRAAGDLVAAYPYQVTGRESLAEIAGAFPRLADRHHRHAWDTVERVADRYGMSASELRTLDREFERRLCDADPGEPVEVPIGVTPQSLAAANPDWPLNPESAPGQARSLSLGRLEHQIGVGESFASIAGRYGANVGTWLTNDDVRRQLNLLRAGARLAIPAASVGNPEASDTDLMAAYLYVRLHDPQAFTASTAGGIPLVDWYVQAISTLNSGAGPASSGVVPGVVLRVPRGYDDLANPLTWTVRRGDDLWTVAATFTLRQNPYIDTGYGTWRQAVATLNPGTGPLARIQVPTTATTVHPGETLDALVDRLPFELPGGAGWLDRETSVRQVVAGQPVLTPLAVVTVPGCVVPVGSGDTLGGIAARYGLPTEELGRRIADVPGVLAPRSGVPFTVPHPPAVPVGASPALAGLIRTVVAEHAVEIAGQVSRYLVSGLRLPTPDADGGYDPHAPLAGLYELIGQQLVGPTPPSACPPTDVRAPMVVTVANYEPTATWLKLYDSTTLTGQTSPTGETHRLNPGLAGREQLDGLVALTGEVDRIEFRITDEDLCARLPEPVLRQTFRTPPAARTNYLDAPVRHPLAQRTLWQTTDPVTYPAIGDGPAPADGVPTLWRFSADLRAAVRARTDQPFTLYAADARPDRAAVELTHYTWATLVDVRIRTVPGMPYLVELLGAGPADRQALLDLWRHLADPATTKAATVRLLYRSTASGGAPTGLISTMLDDEQTYLVRTNLSTETRSPTEVRVSGGQEPPTHGDHYARRTDPADFLRLVWECSVVGGGGYWLRYAAADGTPLPGAIFGADGIASLSLLVDLAGQPGPDRRLRSFSNVAVVADPVDATTVDLFAQVTDGSEVRRSATVEPGRVAVAVSLDQAPAVTAPTVDRQVTARQLYSLIGYDLAASAAFQAGGPALPVGPQTLGVPDGSDDPPGWDLFAVLPVARYARAHPLPAGCGLPDPLADPYAGISLAGEDGPPVRATAEVRLWFQDVLGNASTAGEPPAGGGPLPVSVPVGYTDAVIGVGAWPATTSSFQVTRPASGAAPDGSAASADRTGGPPADGPRAGGPGAARLVVTVAVQTSTHLPDGQQRADRAAQIAADHRGRYQQVWYQLMQPHVTTTLATTLHTRDGQPIPLPAGGRLATFVAGTHAWLGTTAQLGTVGVDAAVATDLAGVCSAYGVSYAGLAAANERIPIADIFPPPPPSPVEGVDFTVEVSAVFRDGDTVTGLCRPGWSPEQVLTDEHNIGLPLRTGVELGLPERTWPIPPDPTEGPPTLTELAAQQRVSVPSLVRRNAEETGLLRVGFTFTCDDIDIVVTPEHPDVSIRDVADTFRQHGVQYDPVMAAVANADRPGMFRPNAPLVIDRYLVAADETLASNRSGSDPARLAPHNTNTPGLFPTGTPLRLGCRPGAEAFTHTLADAAALYGTTPERLLVQNRTVRLVEHPAGHGATAGVERFAVPGRAALPGSLATRIPYRIGPDATLTGIADLVEHADPTRPSAAVALAESNATLPGVLAGGKLVSVAGQQAHTVAGDSFTTLLARFDPPVTLADLVREIGSSPGFLDPEGLLLTPPAVLPAGRYTPAYVARRYGIDVADLARANRALPGLVVPGVPLTIPSTDGRAVAQADTGRGDTSTRTAVTGAAYTLNSLVHCFAELGVETTVEDAVTANRDVAFLSGGVPMLLPPPPAVLTADFGGQGIWSFPDTIFGVRTWLDVNRPPELVDESFGASADGEVVRGRTEIPPLRVAYGTGPADRYLALQEFTAGLEAAVPVLRLATAAAAPDRGDQAHGADGATAGDTENAEVWAVAFGPGHLARVEVTSPAPDCYALRPLMNSLVSRTRVPIRPLGADGSLGAPASRDFVGRDLEVWARRVLADVELFASAPYASAAYRTPVRPALETLLAAKRKLADGISQGLERVVTSPPPSSGRETDPDPRRDAAREALRQRLLASLSAGYDTDAVVQYDTEVASPWSTGVARLNGAGVVPAGGVNAVASGNATAGGRAQDTRRPPAGPTVGVRVSAAKASLASTSTTQPGDLNFLVDVAREGLTQVVDVDLSFAVTELEFDIRRVIDDYEASRWLTFVHPLTDNPPPGVALHLGRARIPLPVRGHPASPLLGTQAATPTQAQPAGYREAMHWDYAFRYQHQGTAVDQLHLAIEFNRTPPQVPLSDPAADKDLFTTLAQYDTVAPALWELLGRLPDYPTPTATPPGPWSAVENAVTTFANLVAEIAEAWTRHWDRQPAPSPPGETHAFTQTLETTYDTATNTTHYRALCLERTESAGDWPLVSLVRSEGQVTPLTQQIRTPQQCRYEMPPDSPVLGLDSFEMRFTGLHIAARQNAAARVQVVRNAVFPGLPPPREDFIYRTQWSTFPTCCTPLLHWRTPWPVGQWHEQPTENPLRAVFAELFGTEEAASYRQLISCGVRFGYPLATGSDPTATITPYLPVTFNPKGEYRPGDTTEGTLGRLIQQVDSWYARTAPAATDGSWLITINLFSSVADQLDRPLLVLPVAMGYDTTGRGHRAVRAGTDTHRQ